MRQRLRPLVIVWLIGGAVLWSAPPPDEPIDYATLTRIRDEGLGHSQVMDHASWLTDVYGPRLTGTPAISQAGDWIAKRFQEWGLSNIHRETFPFGKGWTLRRFSAHLVDPQFQPLIGYPKTWSAGTTGPITAEVVRVDVRSDADLAKYPGKLAGKIVLTQPARDVAMLENTIVNRWTEESLEESQRTPFGRTDPFLFAGPATPVRPRTEPTLAEKLDQLFVAEKVVATLDRGADQSLVRGDNQMEWMTQRTDGGTLFVGHGPRDAAAGTGVPAVTLAVEHYNRLVRVLDKNLPVKVELNIDVEFHNETTPNGFNLIAELPGTDLAGEIVMLGAHMDSYSWATGATDNAAGVSVMMEALRILKTIGAKPRRTIRVGFWGGEEEGLLGSRAYVREHLADAEAGLVKPGHAKHTAYYNLDNGTGRIRGLWLQGNYAAESIFRQWFQPLRDLGVSTIAPRSVRGSDYASFDDVGVPGFQFMQDRLEYNSRTHHSNMDFYDRLQRDDLVQMAVVMASVAYNTAVRAEALPRKPLPFKVATATPTTSAQGAVNPAVPNFEPAQPDTFSAAGGQPNAWADFDNDGDLDLFVGFRGGVNNKLYRNDAGKFVDVATELGVADAPDTRAAAWGDFDSDGWIDLFVGFGRRTNTPNKLYRNLGAGKGFADVAAAAGVTVVGETRQPSFVDFDNDGDIDLFIAFRDAPNALLRNDAGHFTDVAATLGVADDRKTVGSVWFDYDEDGDLDLYTANQDGTLNGLFRNDVTKFTDVAATLGVDAAGMPRAGSNGPSVVDFDNDGDLDLFVADYGPNMLFRHDGAKFTEVAAAMGVAGGEKATPSNWGDYDNDGRPDLYVSSYVDKVTDGKDYLYHNDGDRFSQVMPDLIRQHPASHGILWADFDGDGDLDLALADNNAPGRHYLYRNLLPAAVARRSIQVQVVDALGHQTKAGSEVRVFAAGTRKVLGTRLVDTGSGYCSQSVLPVHVGLPTMAKVDVEVVAMTPTGRRVIKVAGVDPAALKNKPLVVKVTANPSRSPK